MIINNNNAKSFFLRPVGDIEVHNHIQEMKSNKNTGKSGIHKKKYIKLTANVIAPILTKLYNRCIIEGHFPDVLKIAEVKPLHKAGPKNKCSNYRPISILSPFSKIFDKCLHTQLYNYLTQNNLLCKNQYGFMKHSSTSD